MKAKRTAAVLGAVALITASIMASFALQPSPAEAQAAPGASGLVVLESTQSFEQTWTSLIAALDANPAIRTIAQVDHGAAAAGAGLALENNRVVFFGNPALGTPLMQASRTVGIDLPQKMQVFQDGGRVFVAYNPPAYLSTRHQTGDVATLANIGGALSGLARSATNTQGGATAPLLSPPAPGAGLTTTTSANDFETTWSALIAAIERSPASVAFTVDHGANSGGVLPPTRLVVFGNPAIGTPIMDSSATAGIDLPLKMLVFEDDAGVTQVVSTTPGFVQSRHGVGDVPTIGGAANAIQNFTTAATTAVDPPPAVDDATDDASAGDDDATDDASAGDDEVLGVTQLALTGNDPVAALVAVAMIFVGGVFVVGTRRVR